MLHGKHCRIMPLHLSTQANVTNTASARFWEAQGVSRLNLARELGLAEIRQIRAATGVELEVFVHGALCISYSGRCMLSNYFTGRDANRGDCAHPCRYAYRLVEEKRPGQYFPVEEDERGTYIFNSRDLCLLHRLPQLVAAGVDSLKIEGRMKAVGYVGGVVRVYRAALDWIRDQVESGADIEGLALPAQFHEEIRKLGTRGWTENFFDAPPDDSAMMYDRMRMEQPWVPVGIVRQTDPLVIETRHVLEKGDSIEYLGRNLETACCTVARMSLEDGTEIERANPGTRIILRTEPVIGKPEGNSLLRKKMHSLTPRNLFRVQGEQIHTAHRNYLVISAALSAASDVASFVSDTASLVTSTVLSAASTAASLVADAASLAISAVLSATLTAASLVADAASLVISAVLSAASTAASLVADAASLVISAVGLPTAASLVADAASLAISAVLSALNSRFLGDEQLLWFCRRLFAHLHCCSHRCPATTTLRE